MKKLGWVIGLAAVLLASSVEAMSVEEFLATAARIPRNPLALLRPDTRRLMTEVNTAFATIRADDASARAAGRRPATCMPERMSLSADQVLARLNSVPTSRRSMTVTGALREWMAERYPCPR